MSCTTRSQTLRKTGRSWDRLLERQDTGESNSAQQQDAAESALWQARGPKWRESSSRERPLWKAQRAETCQEKQRVPTSDNSQQFLLKSATWEPVRFLGKLLADALFEVGPHVQVDLVWLWHGEPLPAHKLTFQLKEGKKKGKIYYYIKNQPK